MLQQGDQASEGQLLRESFHELRDQARIVHLRFFVGLTAREALEKDHERRDQTTLELASDLRCLLRGA